MKYDMPPTCHLALEIYSLLKYLLYSTYTGRRISKYALFTVVGHKAGVFSLCPVRHEKLAQKNKCAFCAGKQSNTSSRRAHAQCTPLHIPYETFALSFLSKDRSPKLLLDQLQGSMRRHSCCTGDMPVTHPLVLCF